MKAEIREWLVGQFGTDVDVIAEIYAEYVKSSHEKVVELDRALADGDLARVDRIAHTLKGNALMTGDRETADAAIALRQAALGGDAGACAAHAGTVRSLVAVL